MKNAPHTPFQHRFHQNNKLPFCGNAISMPHAPQSENSALRLIHSNYFHLSVRWMQTSHRAVSRQFVLIHIDSFHFGTIAVLHNRHRSHPKNPVRNEFPIQKKNNTVFHFDQSGSKPSRTMPYERSTLTARPTSQAARHDRMRTASFSHLPGTTPVI